MNRVAENLSALPAMCASRHPSTGNPIYIKRGISGYWNAPSYLDVENFNRKRGITAGHVEAMEIGSMFGWGVPGVALALLEAKEA